MEILVNFFLVNFFLVTGNSTTGVMLGDVLVLEVVALRHSEKSSIRNDRWLSVAVMQRS